ncbi:MAG: cache domain-containing protein [Anaerolineales bacterium]|nr:cache domain-containing protein [Anaerolineales bacterium]
MRAVRGVALSAALCALLMVLTSCGWGTDAAVQTPLALSRVNNALHTGAEDLTVRLNQAATALKGKTPEEAPVVLEMLCTDVAEADHCFTVDGARAVTAITPASASGQIGTVAHLWQSQAPEPPVSETGTRINPGCSQVYRSPAGFEGMDAGVMLDPVGGVALTLRLADWLDAVIGPALEGMPFEVWVMQPDGLILYDANREEVGRNLFVDPLYNEYPSLQELGKRIAAEEAGGGVYTFLREDMQEPVEKTATWTTFDFCGQPWRIVLAHGGGGREEGALVSETGLEAAQNALRKLATDPVLSDALATGDAAWGRTAFRSLYDAYPDVYSVQFVDKDGVNQYGYPPENSLEGYDFRSLQSERDAQFLAIVQREHEATADTPLLEGPMGHFFLVPVYQGDQYLGMIYTIQTDR